MMKYGRFKATSSRLRRMAVTSAWGVPLRRRLHEYHITGKAEDVWAEVRLKSITEPWRPETGHLIFGPGGETIFAWAPFVPAAR